MAIIKLHKWIAIAVMILPFASSAQYGFENVGGALITPDLKYVLVERLNGRLELWDNSGERLLREPWTNVYLHMSRKIASPNSKYLYGSHSEVNKEGKGYLFDLNGDSPKVSQIDCEGTASALTNEGKLIYYSGGSVMMPGAGGNELSIELPKDGWNFYVHQQSGDIYSAVKKETKRNKKTGDSYHKLTLFKRAGGSDKFKEIISIKDEIPNQINNLDDLLGVFDNGRIFWFENGYLDAQSKILHPISFQKILDASEKGLAEIAIPEHTGKLTDFFRAFQKAVRGPLKAKGISYVYHVLPEEMAIAYKTSGRPELLLVFDLKTQQDIITLWPPELDVLVAKEKAKQDEVAAEAARKAEEIRNEEFFAQVKRKHTHLEKKLKWMSGEIHKNDLNMEDVTNVPDGMDYTIMMPQDNVPKGTNKPYGHTYKRFSDEGLRFLSILVPAQKADKVSVEFKTDKVTKTFALMEASEVLPGLVKHFDADGMKGFLAIWSPKKLPFDASNYEVTTTVKQDTVPVCIYESILMPKALAERQWDSTPRQPYAGLSPREAVQKMMQEDKDMMSANGWKIKSFGVYDYNGGWKEHEFPAYEGKVYTATVYSGTSKPGAIEYYYTYSVNIDKASTVICSKLPGRCTLTHNKLKDGGFLKFVWQATKPCSYEHIGIAVWER